MEVLQEMVKCHPLGALVTLGSSGIAANHIPFLFDTGAGTHGTLRGHVARTNPVWREISSEYESLVIFQGPASYISPSWYPSKRKHGKAVPTWNYVVVHARGTVKIIEDASWLFNHVSELSETHESSMAIPWKVTDAPSEFIEQLIGAIVGIELPITNITGKWKVSQNRSETDKIGIVAGLESEKCEGAAAISKLINGG